MLPANFSRMVVERLAVTDADGEGLRPRSLGELLHGTELGESHPKRDLLDSATALAEWLPPGLHAVVGAPGIGQFELVWFMAREVACTGKRVLFLSLDQDTPTFLRRVLEQQRQAGDPNSVSVETARETLSELPIDVLEAPTLGVDDVFELTGKIPDLALVVIDSFDRIVPSHLEELGHFARRHAAITLAATARAVAVPIVATSSVVTKCVQCGAPGPGVFPAVGHDPLGLASEADYLWALNRESYWQKDGDPALAVWISGRDGTSLHTVIEPPMMRSGTPQPT
ncbi:MAG: AAA family ATPase [Myxococcales bacterium]|nr:AAA family ATPase [Myxococcales bacterium]